MLSCALLQMAWERKRCDLDPLGFTEANKLMNSGMKNDLFEGEDKIVVEDLLTTFFDGQQQYFKSLSDTWMPYEFLVGKDPCCIE